MTAEPAVPRDPRRVDLFDADQTRYWTRELGASAQVLSEAVAKAGLDVEQVRAYLASGS
jgi:hypothetical protein